MYMSTVPSPDTAMSGRKSSPFSRPNLNRAGAESSSQKPQIKKTMPFSDITPEHLMQLAGKMDALIEKQVSKQAEPHRWL